MMNGQTGVTSPRKRKLKDVVRGIVRRRRAITAFSIQPSQICDNCKAMNITLDKFIIQGHSSDRSQQAYRSQLAQSNLKASNISLTSGSRNHCLGTVHDIVEKSERCPLCLLVKRSLESTGKYGSLDGANPNCYASWQVDGRELERDPLSRQVTSIRPRTRRIRLRWDFASIPESYLVLISREARKPDRPDATSQQPWNSEAMFLGRYISTAPKNSFLVKNWLELCHRSHKRCTIHRGKNFEEMIRKPYFGVIDVHEMRLTSLPPESRYIALSYMWGDNDQYKTTLRNIQTHQEPAGLEKVLPKLSKVALDAIALVRGLGERYIWIDSLCIVQDSQTSWDLNARVMDLVYGNAHLTICAADGDGADAGLCGLDNSRSVEQHQEECAENIRLMVSQTAETYINISKWNTRAWTFQERLLSRRCLIFTGQRVYYQCRSAGMSEDIVAESEAETWSIELADTPLQLLEQLNERAFFVYMTCVELYNKRNLRHAYDILAAFNGMANLLSQHLGAPLVFGLPSSHFDLALLWGSDTVLKRRTEELAGRRFGGKQFPSWSWSGWMSDSGHKEDSGHSEVRYSTSTFEGCLPNVHQWLMEHTWIIWFIRDGHGSLRLVWDAARHREFPKGLNERWSGYSSKYPEGPESFDEYGRKIRKEFSECPRTSFRRTLPEYPYTVSMVERGSEPDVRFDDQIYLQFFSYSAFLRIIARPQPEGKRTDERMCRYDIADYNSDWCGSIMLDREWAEPLIEAGNDEHEFIAISDARSFTKEERPDWTYYIPKGEEQYEWDLYHVLLVESGLGRKADVCQRVGLGKVFKQAFSNSFLPGSDWREFIMK